MKRIPKVGDFVRLGDWWSSFYEVKRIEGNKLYIGVGSIEIYYYLNDSWKFRDPEKPVLDLTKPVQTRDGRPVRILCTDCPGDSHPIVGIIGTAVCRWSMDGEAVLSNIEWAAPEQWRLVNVPEKPKSVVRYVAIQSDGNCVMLAKNVNTLDKAKSRIGTLGNHHKITGVKEITITEGEGM